MGEKTQNTWPLSPNHAQTVTFSQPHTVCADCPHVISGKQVQRGRSLLNLKHTALAPWPGETINSRLSTVVSQSMINGPLTRAFLEVIAKNTNPKVLQTLSFSFRFLSEIPKVCTCTPVILIALKFESFLLGGLPGRLWQDMLPSNCPPGLSTTVQCVVLGNRDNAVRHPGSGLTHCRSSINRKPFKFACTFCCAYI